MGRRDAIKVKMEPFKKLELYLMRRRCDSQVFYTPNYDLTKTIPFIEKYNKGRNKKEQIKFFKVFLAAAVRSLALHPEVNRFISGRQIWQRNSITLSFVVKKQLKSGGEETFAIIKFSPYDTLEDAAQRIHNFIYEAKSEEGNVSEGEYKFFAKMPKLLLMFFIKILDYLEFLNLYPKSVAKGDPMRASVMLANLGSVGLDGNIVHHLYEFGTIPIFITINKITKIPVVNQETDEIEVRRVVPVGIAIDERVSEGFDLSLTLKDLRYYIENPETLMKPPNLKKYQLKPFSKKYLEAREKELETITQQDEA
jgi:hypothetical protein